MQLVRTCKHMQLAATHGCTCQTLTAAQSGGGGEAAAAVRRWLASVASFPSRWLRVRVKSSINQNEREPRCWFLLEPRGELNECSCYGAARKCN